MISKVKINDLITFNIKTNDLITFNSKNVYLVLDKKENVNSYAIFLLRSNGESYWSYWEKSCEKESDIIILS